VGQGHRYHQQTGEKREISVAKHDCCALISLSHPDDADQPFSILSVLKYSDAKCTRFDGRVLVTPTSLRATQIDTRYAAASTA
jgi:hypothetical protein